MPITIKARQTSMGHQQIPYYIRGDMVTSTTANYTGTPQQTHSWHHGGFPEAEKNKTDYIAVKEILHLAVSTIHTARSTAGTQTAPVGYSWETR